MSEKSFFTHVLQRSFYERDTIVVAQDLIGKILVRSIGSTIIAGRIVETEAYGFDNDSASHTFRGMTQRTQALFGLPGCAYIYFSYGNHFCLNAVARSSDIKAGGVLIRAIEPLQGIDYIRTQRKKSVTTHLTNGPGKLTQALSINRDLYGIDLTESQELFIAQPANTKTVHIQATPRIGISSAQEKLWRFVEQK